MPERKRPWWMLHWPSWVAMVVFGGAFVVLNLPSPIAWGWPFMFGRGWQYAVPFCVASEWSWPWVVANIAVALVATALTTLWLERHCSGVRLTLRGMLVSICVVGFVIALLQQFARVIGASDLVKEAALVTTVIAMIFAIRAAADFLEWLFSPKKREA